ncbi:cytidine deaminase-like fold-containing protein [Labrys monachus]|uniref:Putative cytidine deaminase C-terminal domain-containing protein n=1 Tax=Labrys monachus TaxID=217067 RepID=A0ABU0FLB8_9HYPH|nr:hypothetical protein [Labrys monachus]MDQ0395395.1 hypothetical protein [Labrys monachus]
MALDNAAMPPAPPRPGAGTDIDLSASAASEIARTGGIAGVDPSPIAQALFPRLVQNNLKTNGGDIPAAKALAAADLRKPVSDTPVRYAYLLRTGKSGPGQSGILVPKPQAPLAPSAPPPSSGETPTGETPASPQSTGRVGYVGMPEEPLTAMPLSEFLSRYVKRGGLANAADLVAAGLFSALTLPSDMSEPYQGTLIPKSYSLLPFGGTDVPPAVSSYIWKEATKASTAGVDLNIVTRFRAENFSDFNSDINAARALLPDQPGPEDYKRYYLAGGYDFLFAPPQRPGGKVTVVALRTTAGWLSPAGPWWGDPDAWQRSQQPGATATTSSAAPTATADDPPARQPIQVQPSHGVDDAYDPADYQAARNAGLSHEAATVQAKNNYRNSNSKETTESDRNKNDTYINETANPPPPWTKALFDAKTQAETDYALKARTYQMANPGKTLRKPDVFAVGRIDDRTEYSVNQRSRPDYIDPNQDTLIGGHVRDLLADTDRTQNANEKQSNAHAELAVLQKFYDSGLTQGGTLRMIVTGQDLCRFCLRDLPVAANNSGLQELTIYQEFSGKTLIWKKGSDKFLTIDGVTK